MTKVLLYSGGMDSYCLAHHIKPDVVLFFNLGTIDNQMELAQLKQSKFADRVKIIDGINIGQFELVNKIIPHRNTILSLIASNYGNEIYIGATEGDSTKDKDFVWSSQVEGMLNYFGLDKEKVAHKEYPYRIQMPYKNMTKAEILRQYIDEKGDINLLMKESRSCYLGKEKECGGCRSCLRKAVAFALNNIDYKNIFEIDPLSNVLEEDIKKMRNRGREGQDLDDALTLRMLK
jgi:7-cyano-7-deazaguanine synthase in queuosine biosynthesis